MKLFPHQEDALKQTEGFQNIAIYHDMGLGKTFTGSEAMKRFGTSVNLIVCQKSKVRDWVDHFFNNYIDKRKCDESGAWCYDLTTSMGLDMFFHSRYSVKIGVINYDLIWRRTELLRLHDFTLILDESSLIQHQTSKRTKFIMKMNPNHVILLSGTPVGGKYENLWTQIHLLGWNISEDLYERQYVNWDLIEVGDTKHKVVRKSDPYKNTERLKQKLHDHGAVFLKTDEVMDLPEQTFQKIMVNAPTEYKRFVKHSIVEIETKKLVGDTSLTKLLYERQICGMYNQNKIDAVRDLLQSTNDRVIIFYNFNEELFRLKDLCHELERPTSEVNGHTKDLTAYDEESNSVTLCQYQSASKGLNLQKCNKIVYFTLPLSSEDFEQSKKRTHRIGQERPCFYYLIISSSSVEESILDTLEQRKDYTDELFRKENK